MTETRYLTPGKISTRSLRGLIGNYLSFIEDTGWVDRPARYGQEDVEIDERKSKKHTKLSMVIRDCLQRV